MDIRDDRRRRDTIEKEQRDDEPIPGPSREFLRAPSPAPARNAKKARVEDRAVQRADEKDDETPTEEDVECTCDVVTQDEHSRIRPSDRPRVITKNQRNGRRRDDTEEDEEDEAERMKEEDEEDEEDDEERVEEENEDSEDSVYEELRARGPRRRTTARERELKRWIRRCRQECERRRGR